MCIFYFQHDNRRMACLGTIYAIHFAATVHGIHCHHSDAAQFLMSPTVSHSFIITAVSGSQGLSGLLINVNRTCVHTCTLKIVYSIMFVPSVSFAFSNFCNSYFHTYTFYSLIVWLKLFINLAFIVLASVSFKTKYNHINVHLSLNKHRFTWELHLANWALGN